MKKCLKLGAALLLCGGSAQAMDPSQEATAAKKALPEMRNGTTTGPMRNGATSGPQSTGASIRAMNGSNTDPQLTDAPMGRKGGGDGSGKELAAKTLEERARQKRVTPLEEVD